MIASLNIFLENKDTYLGPTEQNLLDLGSRRANLTFWGI